LDKTEGVPSRYCLVFEKKKTTEKNHKRKITINSLLTMSARGKKSSGEMKVEDVAGGSFTPEKRRLDMTEDGHSSPKEISLHGQAPQTQS
jgi:hypothetical protein